jgi:hypothetical protein
MLGGENRYCWEWKTGFCARKASDNDDLSSGDSESESKNDEKKFAMEIAPGLL